MGPRGARGLSRPGCWVPGSSAHPRRERVPGWVAAKRDPARGGCGSGGKEEAEKGEGGGGEEEAGEGGGGGRGGGSRPAVRAEEFAARAAGLPQEPRDQRGGGRGLAAA